MPKDHPACKSIAANSIANFFGLGWAATPAGLQAMEDLDELEKERTLMQAVGQTAQNRYDFGSDRILREQRKKGKAASTEMCTFLVLNISSLQLIPVTVIAYRSQYGSPGSGRNYRGSDRCHDDFHTVRDPICKNHVCDR